MNWGDLFNALSALSQVANTGFGIWRGMQTPSTPQFVAPPPPQPMKIEIPDMSEFFAMQMEGMNMMQQQMLAQAAAAQEASNAQAAQFKADQMKANARMAAGTRKGLQERGIYGDPNEDVGAASSEAVASMMGLPPEELLAALKQYGGDFGWQV